MHRRVDEFCERYGLRIPVLEAPMAGACPPELAIAVAEAGGMGANGVVLDSPDRIAGWVERFRDGSAGPLQLNVWVRDPPVDDPGRHRVPAPLRPPGPEGGSVPAFTAQCAAMLAAAPTAVLSIMGLFDADYVARLHERGIAWLATATALDDALAAEEARSLVFTTEEPMEGEGLRALERAVQRRAHGRRQR